MVGRFYFLGALMPLAPSVLVFFLQISHIILKVLKATFSWHYSRTVANELPVALPLFCWGCEMEISSPLKSEVSLIAFSCSLEAHIHTNFRSLFTNGSKMELTQTTHCIAQRFHLLTCKPLTFGSIMASTLLSMLVSNTWALVSFLSQWAASQIRASGPFLLNTKWA